MESVLENVKNALSKEADNKDGVYLYLEGNVWCAYERSAYYLLSSNASVKLNREVVKEKNGNIVLKVYFNADDMCFPLTPKMKLREMADDTLMFHMNSSVGGFSEWRESQLNRLPA